MPQSEDSTEVSFTIPYQKDSASATELRTVHVVFPKSRQPSNTEVVIRPLFFILPAILVVVLMYKIRDGRSTQKVFDIIERITTRITDNRKSKKISY